MDEKDQAIEDALKRIEERETLAHRVSQIIHKAPPPADRWYDKPILVGFLGTLIAAVVPATSAIDGCISKSKDLELAETKLKHEISTDYVNSYALKDALTQALNPELSQTHRLRALRFLGRVAPDLALREWAMNEYREATTYVEIDRALQGLEKPRAPGVEERTPSAEGSLQGQWMRNDPNNDEDPRVRLTKDISEDAKDPNGALSRIQREIEQLDADPYMPEDEKDFRRSQLKERLQSLKSRSDFAHVDNLPGAGNRTNG